MTPESIDNHLEPQPETPLSHAALLADPELYRNQLLILLEHLPWSHTIKYAPGNQAERLVEFCLDPDHLEPIETYIENVPENSLEDPRTTAIYEAIMSEKPDSMRASDQRLLDEEKRLRLRLLAWTNYLGSLIASNGDNGDHSAAENQPAASGF